MNLAFAQVRALLVALIGALLAWSWFRGHHALPVVAAAALILVAIGSQALGDAYLPAKPVVARRLLEGWVLAQVVLAAVAAALVIIVTVELAAPTGATEETKQLLSSLTTGITAFVTAMLVGSTDDANTRVGQTVKSRFQRHFQVGESQSPKRRVYYLRPESEAVRWVYSDNYGGVSSWDWSARAKRATELAKRLDQDVMAGK